MWRLASSSVMQASPVRQRVPEILDPVDVVAGACEELGMVDPVVLERAHVQRVISLLAVRIDDAVGHNLALNDWHQRAALGVGDHTGVNLSSAPKQAKNRDFPCRSTSSFTFAPAAEVALVHLDLSAEYGFAPCLQFLCKDLTQAMEIERGRVPVNADKPRGRPCRRSGNEMLEKTILPSLADTALSHGFLDTPQPIWRV